MKYRLLVLLLAFPLFSVAQERGVGVRIGEPFSITYKDFFDDYFSYELMVGTGSPNGGTYYQRDFDNNPPGSNSFYVNHNTQKGISLHGRVALHEDFTDMFDITEGYLLGYAGAGIQLRTTNVTYTYTEGQVGGSVPLTEKRNNIDFGPEVFGGGEYYFDEIPISVFAEIGFFLELLDRVGHIKGQGGIGVRYLF